SFLIDPLPRDTIVGALTDYANRLKEYNDSVAGFVAIVRNDPILTSFESLITQFEDGIRSLTGSATGPTQAPQARSQDAGAGGAPILPQDQPPPLPHPPHPPSH